MFQPLSQHSSDAHVTGAESGGLIDEEVKTVAMEFPSKDRGISLPSRHRSNDDDDEFWDVSGH